MKTRGVASAALALRLDVMATNESGREELEICKVQVVLARNDRGGDEITDVREFCGYKWIKFCRCDERQ
jgi:hypothetical protein